MDYACFLQFKPQGWRLHEIVETEAERDLFIENAKDMMKARMNGLQVIGYDVHELTNKAES